MDLFGNANVSSIADYASIVGLFITVVGFFVTIYNVIRMKSVVARVREDMQKTQMVADFSVALQLIDQIKLQQNEERVDGIVQKYNSLRKTILAIKCSLPEEFKEKEANLQKIIQHLSNFELITQKAIKKNTSIPFLKMLKTTDGFYDVVYEIHVQLKNSIGN